MSFTHSTSSSAVAWRPDQFTFAPETVLAEALIFQATTVAGHIEGDAPSLRVAYALDADANFVDEGADIDESEPELAEALVYTKKFAQLLRITREQYKQAGTPEHLSQSVARAMITKADNALLAQGAPVSPAVAPSTGLANAAGIISQGSVTDDLDKLVDLEATVRANRGNPQRWILAPDTWAGLRKLKTGTAFNSTLLGAGTDDADPRLLSLPVLLNPEMPRRTGMLIDPTAIVSAVSDLTIATSAESYFKSDSIGVRATMRTGHTMVRPDRIGVFYIDGDVGWVVTLGAPSAGTFTLTWRGKTTTAIAYNAASGTTVKNALGALDDGYTAADWTVAGPNGGPYAITAPGGGALTGSGAALTDGTFSIAAAA
ncbi:phage major capsid protein [Mycolicibacterium vinylchloridicum]|uniref:phage major capsid protein n=1 Tax=Mycolicibacterium vinylchloridicum TaxID=2736928 RepID=UPI0015CC0E56|nr:phage major capsid protein [Mycolicibacterium vinylchloridicum]